uniref:Dynein axonemal assembly factor 1 homolog n=1 Tax=Stomoxys calcitrans TaxID=35570 RepID=A0A1I8P4S2_STOCA
MSHTLKKSNETKEIGGLNRITKKKLLELCKKDKLYQTPSLNDVLYLHYQGFQSIESLEDYTELKCLWLECNAISEIQGLENQTKLKCLYLQSNLIKKIDNLDPCKELDTINLSQNHIRKIENVGIDILPVLNTLNISSNYLKDCEGLRELENCKNLSVLDLSNNRIDDILVVKVFARMPELKVLVLQGNPVVSKIPQYRKTLILECKKLTYLDSRPVFPKDRACAEAWKRGGYEEERKENERWNRKERRKMRDSVNATIKMRNKFRKPEDHVSLLVSSDSEEDIVKAKRICQQKQLDASVNMELGIWEEVAGDDSKTELYLSSDVNESPSTSSANSSSDSSTALVSDLSTKCHELGEQSKKEEPKGVEVENGEGEIRTLAEKQNMGEILKFIKKTNQEEKVLEVKQKEKYGVEEIKQFELESNYKAENTEGRNKESKDVGEVEVLEKVSGDVETFEVMSHEALSKSIDKISTRRVNLEIECNEDAPSEISMKAQKSVHINDESSAIESMKDSSHIRDEISPRRVYLHIETNEVAPRDILEQAASNYKSMQSALEIQESSVIDPILNETLKVINPIAMQATIETNDKISSTLPKATNEENYDALDNLEKTMAMLKPDIAQSDITTADLRDIKEKSPCQMEYENECKAVNTQLKKDFEEMFSNMDIHLNQFKKDQEERHEIMELLFSQKPKAAGEEITGSSSDENVERNVKEIEGMVDQWDRETKLNDFEREQLKERVYVNTNNLREQIRKEGVHIEENESKGNCKDNADIEEQENLEENMLMREKHENELLPTKTAQEFLDDDFEYNPLDVTSLTRASNHALTSFERETKVLRNLLSKLEQENNELYEELNDLEETAKIIEKIDEREHKEMKENGHHSKIEEKEIKVNNGLRDQEETNFKEKEMEDKKESEVMEDTEILTETCENHAAVNPIDIEMQIRENAERPDETQESQPKNDLNNIREATGQEIEIECGNLRDMTQESMEKIRQDIPYKNKAKTQEISKPTDHKKENDFCNEFEGSDISINNEKEIQKNAKELKQENVFNNQRETIGREKEKHVEFEDKRNKENNFSDISYKNKREIQVHAIVKEQSNQREIIGREKEQGVDTEEEVKKDSQIAKSQEDPEKHLPNISFKTMRKICEIEEVKENNKENYLNSQTEALDKEIANGNDIEKEQRQMSQFPLPKRENSPENSNKMNNKSKKDISSSMISKANEEYSEKITQEILNDIIDYSSLKTPQAKPHDLPTTDPKNHDSDHEEEVKQNANKPQLPLTGTIHAVLESLGDIFKKIDLKPIKRLQSVAPTDAEKAVCYKNLLENHKLKEFNQDTPESLDKLLNDYRNQEIQDVQEMVERVYAQKEEYDGTIELIDGRLMVLDKESGQIKRELSSQKFNNDHEFSDADYETAESDDEGACCRKTRKGKAKHKMQFIYNTLSVNRVPEHCESDGEEFHSLDPQPEFSIYENIHKEFFNNLSLEHLNLSPQDEDHLNLCSRSYHELKHLLTLNEEHTTLNDKEIELLETIKGRAYQAQKNDDNYALTDSKTDEYRLWEKRLQKSAKRERQNLEFETNSDNSSNKTYTIYEEGNVFQSVSSHRYDCHSNVTQSDFSHNDDFSSDFSYNNASQGDISCSRVSYSDVFHNHASHSDVAHSDVSHSVFSLRHVPHSNVSHGDVFHCVDSLSDAPLSEVLNSNVSPSNVSQIDVCNHDASYSEVSLSNASSKKCNENEKIESDINVDYEVMKATLQKAFEGNNDKEDAILENSACPLGHLSPILWSHNLGRKYYSDLKYGDNFEDSGLSSINNVILRCEDNACSLSYSLPIEKSGQDEMKEEELPGAPVEDFLQHNQTVVSIEDMEQHDNTADITLCQEEDEIVFGGEILNSQDLWENPTTSYDVKTNENVIPYKTLLNTGKDSLGEIKLDSSFDNKSIKDNKNQNPGISDTNSLEIYKNSQIYNKPVSEELHLQNQEFLPLEKITKNLKINIEENLTIPEIESQNQLTSLRKDNKYQSEKTLGTFLNSSPSLENITNTALKTSQHHKSDETLNSQDLSANLITNNDMMAGENVTTMNLILSPSHDTVRKTLLDSSYNQMGIQACKNQNPAIDDYNSPDFFKNSQTNSVPVSKEINLQNQEFLPLEKITTNLKINIEENLRIPEIESQNELTSLLTGDRYQSSETNSPHSTHFEEKIQNAKNIELKTSQHQKPHETLNSQDLSANPITHKDMMAGENVTTYINLLKPSDVTTKEILSWPSFNQVDAGKCNIEDTGILDSQDSLENSIANNDMIKGENVTTYINLLKPSIDTKKENLPCNQVDVRECYTKDAGIGHSKSPEIHENSQTSTNSVSKEENPQCNEFLTSGDLFNNFKINVTQHSKIPEVDNTIIPTSPGVDEKSQTKEIIPTSSNFLYNSKNTKENLENNCYDNEFNKSQLFSKNPIKFPCAPKSSTNIENPQAFPLQFPNKTKETQERDFNIPHEKDMKTFIYPTNNEETPKTNNPNDETTDNQIPSNFKNAPHSIVKFTTATQISFMPPTNSIENNETTTFCTNCQMKLSNDNDTLQEASMEIPIINNQEEEIAINLAENYQVSDMASCQDNACTGGTPQSCIFDNDFTANAHEVDILECNLEILDCNEDVIDSITVNAEVRYEI